MTATYRAGVTPIQYRPPTEHAPVQRPQQTYRPPPNTTDDYERWYTEPTPSNRMILSMKSGLDREIGWALDRICRLSHNEQFQLRGLPGLVDVLFEWPQWFVDGGYKEITPMQSLFAVDPDQNRRRRHALESMFALRNSAVTEWNAVELAQNKRTLPLIWKTLQAIKPDAGPNVEFLMHALDLLQMCYGHAASVAPVRVDTASLDALQELAARSDNRSLIIAALSSLTTILTVTPQATQQLNAASPALRASLQYLPLTSDQTLAEACVNFLYTYLSQGHLCRAFLLHPDLSSTLKLLVGLILHEQLEGPVTIELASAYTPAVPTVTVPTKVHDITQQELDDLLSKPEPQRCYDWMRIMFTATPTGELTQVDFWTLYKDTFAPHQSTYPLLVASDVIKNVTVVFPNAQAMVLPGPPQKFVVRGVARTEEPVTQERFACRWERGACAVALGSPQELYEHLEEHMAAQDEGDMDEERPCLWASCPAEMELRALRRHVRTHLAHAQDPARHPSQSIAPGTEPLRTTLTYTVPQADPPSAALTALLCVRILFRAAYATSDEAPRADGEHFGFPGVVEEDEGGAVALIGEEAEDEARGQARGRRAFAGVRGLMEGVHLRDEVLMGWIEEMLAESAL